MIKNHSIKYDFYYMVKFYEKEGTIFVFLNKFLSRSFFYNYEGLNEIDIELVSKKKIDFWNFVTYTNKFILIGIENLYSQTSLIRIKIAL